MEVIRFRNARGLTLAGEFRRGTGPHARTGDRGIVLAHGFTGDRSELGRFDRAAARFQRDGFSVLQFDFAGSGESDDDTLSLAKEGEDLQCALDLLGSRGVRRVGLLGLSLGGLLALRCRDPRVASLALWAPVTQRNRRGFPLSPTERVELGRHGFLTVRTGPPPAQAGDSAGPSTAARAAPASGAPRIPRAEVKVAAEMLAEWQALDQRQLLADVTQEVLILHGDHDPVCPVEDSSHAIRMLPTGSRLHIVPGADHLFAEQLDRFVEMTAEWFRSRIPETRS